MASATSGAQGTNLLGTPPVIEWGEFEKASTGLPVSPQPLSDPSQPMGCQASPIAGSPTDVITTSDLTTQAAREALPIAFPLASELGLPVEERPSTHKLLGEVEEMFQSFQEMLKETNSYIKDMNLLKEIGYKVEVDGMITCTRDKEAFEAKYKPIHEKYIADVKKMTLKTKRVIDVINELATKSHIQNTTKLVALANYSEQWNGTCLFSDQINWNIQIIDASLGVLPKMRSFLDRIHLLWGRVHTKKDIKDMLSPIEKDFAEQNWQSEIETFKALISEAKAIESSLKAALGKLRYVRPTAEQLKEYSQHNQETITLNQSNLDRVAAECNERINELRSLIERDWGCICERLNNYAEQLNHIKTNAYSKTLLRWWHGQDIKSEIVFDPTIFAME